MSKVHEYRQAASLWLEKAVAAETSEYGIFCAMMADAHLKMASLELAMYELDNK